MDLKELLKACETAENGKGKIKSKKTLKKVCRNQKGVYICIINHKQSGAQRYIGTQKNMKAIITATAPTAYQTQSLRAFKMGCNDNGNGSFSASKEFDSVEDAKNYLADLANDYYDGDESAIARNLGPNSLRLDAVSATIEELID